MKTTMMIILTALMSFGAYAQHDHTAHGDQKSDQSAVKFKDDKLGTAYAHYIHLKDALVASNSADAKKAAGELQNSLCRVTGSNANN